MLPIARVQFLRMLLFIYYFLLFSLALQPSAGYGLLAHEIILITHNDMSKSVGLLWTSDQLVTEASS
jgi:hypothetical protein